MGRTSTSSKRKYNEKAYDRIGVTVYKGQKEQIQAFAEARGMSVNAFINKLLAEAMGDKLTEPQNNEA